MSDTNTVDQTGVEEGTEKVDQRGMAGGEAHVDQTRTVDEEESVDQTGTIDETDSVDQTGTVDETETVDQTGEASGTGEVDQSGRVRETERADQMKSVGETGDVSQDGTAHEIERADQADTVDQNGPVDKNRTVGKETPLSGSGGGGEGEDIEARDMPQSTTPHLDPPEDILYEAELEPTHIEQSKVTICGLSCMTVILVIILGILFISSFPFSLFVLLFCVDTKKACQPFRYAKFNPWRLYLTQDSICYHLPNPPHRPYINLFYWRKTPYYTFTIPLHDIADMLVEELGVDEEGTLKRGSKLLETGTRVDYRSIVIELKPSAPGIAVPDYAFLGLRPHFKPSHTLAIFSVKDADTFVEKAKQQMTTAS